MLLILSKATFAETQQLYGFRPQISLTKVVSDRWDINVFTSTNTNLNDKRYGNTQFPPDIQYYFQTGPIYKYSPNLNFVFLGYIYQRTNPFSDSFVNENRLFQQVIYGTDSLFGRLTHRVRLKRDSYITEPLARHPSVRGCVIRRRFLYRCKAENWTTGSFISIFIMSSILA